ncbi:putative deoxynucleoside triphosphate triphosphohydrolase SAMHD1 -like protein isoform X2 [Capsicum annuum]|nr:putative deoxynucleoside triphosphate triphosphohydrolase SAMHD1 -like protein isoform X2 [Capsicum annuum]
MGDYHNGNALLRYNSGDAPFEDRRFSKLIHDNVHGNIHLDRVPFLFLYLNLLFSLRDLKQLGLTYMVYPGAVHSRFEHSLGVYWLASDAVRRLKTYQGLELGIESFDIQTVKLAGLLHDVGHGPFSHMFEREFLPRVRGGIKWSHEDMSLKMIDYIVDEHSIDIDSNKLKKVKEMIVASKEGKSEAIELMVVDALIKANEHFQIAAQIDEPAQYWMLDDTIVKRIETSTHQDLEESRNLIRRIRRRDIYQYCNEFAVPKENLEHFKNVTAQDIICSQNSDAHLNEEDVIVTNVKIDLASGKNNPLERISFFQDYDSFEKLRLKDGCISHLLPVCYQDMIVRVYTRKPELVEAVSKAFENFQIKTYGKKTQVHATPEKKKCLKYKEK